MKVNKRFQHPKWIVGLLTVAIVLLLAVTPSHALFEGKMKSFSAENVEISPDGKVVNTSKFYITPDAIRIDGMPGQRGQDVPKVNLSILILKKQNRQFFYNHDKKLVFKSPVDEKNLKPGYKAMDNIESEKVLGKEKVSGYKCVKKEVVTSYSVMGRTFKNKMLVWESDEFEFPLRTMDEEGNIQEMRKIKTGKPSKKLFRPLSGYKKVANMMAVMGMDFAAMARQDQLKDEEEEKQAKPKDIQDVDVDQMMTEMKKAMGENANPEQMAQMEQAMKQAISQAKQIRTDKGAADAIWQIIPKRPADRIVDEMKTTNTLNVIMGTKTKLKSIFNFYQNKLKHEGWQDGGMYIQNDQGSMTMMKEQRMLMISSADNPGRESNFKFFYNIKLSGPGI